MLSVLDLRKNFNSAALHHAYLFEGDHAAIVPVVCEYIERELSMSSHGNPDLYQAVYAVFGVDEAREFSAAALRRPVLGERLVFIISVRSFTHEAQNALLKLLEEPVPGSHFFFIVPSAGALLPTLLSRFFLVPLYAPSSVKRSEIGTPDAAAEKFLALPLSARLKTLGKIFEDKDVAQATALLNAIELVLFRRGEYRTDPSQHLFLKELARVRAFLTGRSPSLKIIMEHVALTAPAA